MPYLNVDEVETALALAADPANAAFTELLTLPHRTWERRTCQALRIHHGNPGAAGSTCSAACTPGSGAAPTSSSTTCSCSPTPTATRPASRRATPASAPPRGA